jgi:dolichol-phosphate mannosyltransferase
MKKFSIVIPVYYNEQNLSDTVPQLIALGTKLINYKLELVFVDDGSGDRSLELLLDYQKKFPDKIKVVKLTRNFGSMAACQAGFAVATGDCVGIIAADLQDPPELFLEMLDHWEKGVKAVFAVRSDREESHLQKFFSNSYYALIRRFAIPDYPKGGFDFLLVDRQIVDEVNKINEKNTNLMSLIFWLGHPYVMIPYVRRSRMKGKSRWTTTKKIKLFIDSFVAFSYAPIRFLSVFGLFVATISFFYGGFVFYSWAVSKIEIKGYTPLMILLTFTAGLQMVMLGVLGEYLWRTLDETRKRPPYVIDKIFNL